MSYCTQPELGNNGDAIILHQERRYYLKGLLPEEQFEADFQEGAFTNIHLLTPSVHRVKPICTIADKCGGCDFQYMNVDFYQDMKRKMFHKAFSGRFPSEKIQETYCQASSRRRTTLSLYRDSEKFVWGYKQEKSHKIVTPDFCHILQPDFAKTLQEFVPLLQPFIPLQLQGKLSCLQADNGIDLLMKGIPVLGQKKRLELIAILEKFPQIIRVIWDKDLVLQKEVPVIYMGEYPVQAAADMFFQASVQGQDALIQRVKHHLQTYKASRKKTKKQLKIADMFAGAGTFTLPLASEGVIDAYDNASSSLESLKQAVQQNHLVNQITVHHRDLFRDCLSVFELATYDVIVLDPPRQGLGKQVESLAKAKVPCVIMVFCDLQNAVQDATILQQAGYRMRALEFIDQFVYTPHIEGIVVFER